VLDNADRLNASAANAFLKTLEEPKEGRLIWLLAEQPNAMLPTIRSRCLELSLGASHEVADGNAYSEEQAAFQDWAKAYALPATLSETEKDREKALRWVGFLQTQVRNAAFDKTKADPFFSRFNHYDLIHKFEKLLELEARLRSQANYALMLEIFFKTELRGEAT
jgi:hypothetical protein